METLYVVRALCFCSLFICSASQNVVSSLTVVPSPDQAIGSTVRTSITIENTNFNLVWWFGSMSIFQCIFLAPNTPNCAVLTSVITSRVNTSHQIAPTGVTVNVDILNLLPTENGLRIQVLDILNATVDAGKTLNVIACSAITEEGLTSTLSQTPCGFGCTGNFTCAPQDYTGGAVGVCQANATWNVQQPVCSAERSSGLDGGIIALIVILCLLAVGCIVVVVVLYKRKKACFADKADKNPPTEGPACTPLNENQPKNPDSSNDNLSSGQV